jgi:hypothetical protein
MQSRTLVSVLVICAAVALVISSCSKNPMAPMAADLSGPPDTFPPLPQPSTPNQVIPDTSGVYSADVPSLVSRWISRPCGRRGTVTWHIEVRLRGRDPALRAQV